MTFYTIIQVPVATAVELLVTGSPRFPSPIAESDTSKQVSEVEYIYFIDLM